MSCERKEICLLKFKIRIAHIFLKISQARPFYLKNYRKWTFTIFYCHILSALWEVFVGSFLSNKIYYKYLMIA
mgnify:CR=1 FL=1